MSPQIRTLGKTQATTRTLMRSKPHVDPQYVPSTVSVARFTSEFFAA